MRLWTIQPIEVYNILQETHRFICDPKRSTAHLQYFDNFLPAYEWMIKEMEYRIGPAPKDVTYPIWAWYKREGLHKKPDLRYKYGNTKQKMVCMELEVPNNQVVLSDFDLWHFVLNHTYLDPSINEEEYEKNQMLFAQLSKEKQEQSIIESWQHIFDITPISNNFVSQGQYVQATFWELKSEYIIKAQFFTSK